jgi:hypothetical protein
MAYLRGFAPWIVFGGLSAFDWRVAALAGLIIAVLATVYARLHGQPADALILDIGAVLFLVVVAVIGFIDADSPLADWVGALSLAWLAIIAWGSIAIHRPFTLGIARLSVPREMWNHPLFYKVNVTITAVWAATFTVIAVAHTVAGLTHAGLPVSLAIYAAYLVPIIFTNRYPKIMQARYADQLAAEPGTPQ